MNVSSRKQPINSFVTWLLLVVLMVHSKAVRSVSKLPPPEICGEDGCTIVNYQGVWNDRGSCKAANAAYPRTEEELLRAVADGVRQGRKMKVVTEIGHSLSKLSCPDGEEGLLISTRYYASVKSVHVNKSEMTASVDAGVQLRDFVRALAEDGVTVPHTPLWDGVSMGGVIATASHGSGFFGGRGSVVSEYVTALRMVVPALADDGYAKIITLRRGDEDFRAAQVSLGLLGVVSKITFSVMPMFKRSLTIQLAADDDLEDRLLPFSRKYDFASLFWVPSAAKVLYKLETAVSTEEPGDGSNGFPLVQPMPVSRIRAMRSQQDAVERSGDTSELCGAGKSMVESRFSSGDGFQSSPGRFDGYPVVGFNHRMQTVGGCQVDDALIKPSDASDNQERWTCKWDPREDQRIFYFHTAVAVPLENAAAFVRDVKRLRDASPQAMCVLNMFGGIHVRFVSASSAFLGDQKDSAVFELVFYRSLEPGQGRLHQDVIDEIEQMMLFKYNGKPHWGKNRDIAFQGVSGKVVSNDRFLAVKTKLDPDGLFSSSWSDALLGLHDTFWTIDHDHCALEGVCICREDRHCAPSLGYTCQPGRVFSAAKVCRRSSSNFE
ncbi:hypothetical protein KP509_19G052400 [Ceratopteris richardii]|uniref:L-gulonolactone oxidase n=1 Tax=Ceratopteris richardii TaxID=49495 RepID=A0A8T2SNX8_CERRI|nr:hypothetical protein KP509_19G052400 [Ceratopteris richardii]